MAPVIEAQDTEVLRQGAVTRTPVEPRGGAKAVEEHDRGSVGWAGDVTHRGRAVLAQLHFVVDRGSGHVSEDDISGQMHVGDLHTRWYVVHAV
jgi:hypothetical protein